MTEYARTVVMDAMERGLTPVTTGRMVDETGLNGFAVRKALQELEERGEVEKVNGNTFKLAENELGETFIQGIQKGTHEWRTEQFDNLAPIPQTMGTMVEVAEFGGMLVKAEYYDEEWADDERLKEEAGDVIIYFLGVLSLLGYDVVECIEKALEKNYDRDWEEHMEAP